MTDLPYFAWNRTEAERIQAEIGNSTRASEAEPSQHEQPSQDSGSSHVIPASHDA